MGKYLLIIITLCVCGTFIALSNDKPEKKVMSQTIYNEKEARKIAEDYFLIKTDRKIDKYSVTPEKQENDYWIFFFQGKEEFARPGYHWIVKVNKFTGKPEILEGE